MESGKRRKFRHHVGNQQSCDNICRHNTMRISIGKFPINGSRNTVESDLMSILSNFFFFSFYLNRGIYTIKCLLTTFKMIYNTFIRMK